jgi:hypothetical protein
MSPFHRTRALADPRRARPELAQTQQQIRARLRDIALASAPASSPLSPWRLLKKFRRRGVIM